MKQYQLTKQEATDLKAQHDLMAQYEQVTMALKLQFRSYLVTAVFKRLKLDPEKSLNAMVDTENGTLAIPPEPKKEKKKPVKSKREVSQKP